MCKKLQVISPRGCSWTGDIFVQFLFRPMKEQHRLHLSMAGAGWGAVVSVSQADIFPRACSPQPSGKSDSPSFGNCVNCGALDLMVG